jgi:hypothetical protein
MVKQALDNKGVSAVLQDVALLLELKVNRTKGMAGARRYP